VLKRFLPAVEDGDAVAAVKRSLIDPPEKRLERRVADSQRKLRCEAPDVRGAQLPRESPLRAGSQDGGQAAHGSKRPR